MANRFGAHRENYFSLLLHYDDGPAKQFKCIFSINETTASIYWLVLAMKIKIPFEWPDHRPINVRGICKNAFLHKLTTAVAIMITITNFFKHHKRILYPADLALFFISLILYFPDFLIKKKFFKSLKIFLEQFCVLFPISKHRQNWYNQNWQQLERNFLQKLL